jgi:lipid II:glycine glycyltransferase (peptidoglycan interpeptide bridge formation enzyme)
MDIRQTKGWGDYLKAIGWKVKEVDGIQIFIKKIPLFNLSFIKVQRQKNPIPFKKIDKLAKEYKSLMVLVEPSLEDYNDQQFLKNGYLRTIQPVVHTATIQIDLLPSLEKIMSGFSENARRNIRKGLASDIVVKKIFMSKQQDLKQFEVFLKLLKNLTVIKKFWVPDDTEMKKKVKGLKDSILFFAYEKNQTDPIATVWLAKTKDSSHYIQTGITKRGYELLANYVLVWSIIETSKKLKLKYFDFEGVYDPRYPKMHPRWKNFSEFKKRFHGNKIEYPTSWVKFYSFTFKWFYSIGQKLP